MFLLEREWLMVDMLFLENNQSKRAHFQVIKDTNVSHNQFHNTKLLLELYHKVLWRINNSFEKIEEECIETTGKRVDELVKSLVDAELFVSKTRLESRLQSIKDSRSIIDLIDKALLMMKSYPNNGERYYWILYKLYIIPYKYSESEIIEYLCCSRATYFREKKKAINLFGTILWGYLLPTLVQEIKSLNLILD